MPFDLRVPKGFNRGHDIPDLAELDPFRDSVTFAVPCSDPAEPDVIPICLPTNGLRIGDVFLFHMSGLPINPIEFYQNQVCGIRAEAARITHVALYAGQGFLWDHMPGENIKLRTMASMLAPGTTISISRAKRSERIDKDALVGQCRLLQAQFRYDLREAVNWRGLTARARSNVTIKEPDRVARGLVCSGFVHAVLSFASRDAIHIQKPVILPGDFHNGPDFALLDIDWRRMPHP